MSKVNETAVAMVSLYLLQANTGQMEGIPSNPRLIKNKEFEDLKRSILVFPQMLELRPIVYAGEYVALGGNQRRGALLDIAKLTYKQIVAKLEKWQEFTDKTPDDQAIILAYWEAWTADPDKLCPAYDASHLTIEQMAEFVIKDNVQFGENDWDILSSDWDVEKVQNWGVQLPAEWDKEPTPEKQKHAKLTDTFIVPPFSVLDTKQGYWVDRRNEWLGITGNLTETKENVLSANINMLTQINEGSSNFDPVLAEIMLKWFNVEGGKVLDPFGGEQTKGVVCGELGYQYHGVEFRKDQYELNAAKTDVYPHVNYYNGDSNNISKIVQGKDFDFVFTSPPYYDLEVYSKDDMSALGSYKEFMKQYENIFDQCIGKLKDNRFLVVKIAEIRNKKTGEYRNFVRDNITMFERLGLVFYNEIILVNSIGTLPQRVGQWMRNRKVGKMHQNVLVFFKGDVQEIKKEYPELKSYSDED